MKYTVRQTHHVLNALIQFTRADLARFRPGDWLNLDDDLRQFVGSELPPHTRDELAALQSTVAQWLDVLGGATDPDTPRLALTIPQHYVVRHGAIHVEPMTTIADALFVALAYHINADPRHIILRCSECHILFAPIREQQLYCGQPCSSRAALRRKAQRAP